MKRLLLKMCLCLPLLALFACEEDEPAVSLSAPNITNVEVVNDNSVSITWTAVPGAAWYELYRSTNAVDFAYLKRVDGMTSAIDYSPANGKTNYYKVKAANSSTSSPMSAAKSIMVDDNQSGSLVAPTGVEARVSGNSIFLSWTDVPTANKYNVYRCSTANGVYSLLTTTSQTSVTDNSPLSGSNYYKVRSVAANGGISEYSTYAYVNYTSGGGTEEPDEPEELPAPTGVQAYQNGNNIRVEWRAVSGASRYQVYYKGPGYGSYSFANTVHTYIDLTNNLKDGNWSFYVIALNSDYEKGEKSSTVSCRYTSSGGTTPGGGGEEEPTVQAPCPVTYTNCTVSGSKMTLRWRTSTSSGCGKPDKAILRVRESITGQYVDLQELSGTATSVTFTYTGWIGTGTYDAGYVYAGIILENEAGTSGGIPKVYDTKNKRWIN